MPSNQFHRVEKLVGECEDWTAVKYSGSWADVAGTPVKYYKDKFNIVHLRGAAQSGSGNIFTLPEGYRPEQDMYFPCAQGGAYGEAYVATTGVVNNSVGSGAISLDGVSFRV